MFPNVDSEIDSLPMTSDKIYFDFSVPTRSLIVLLKIWHGMHVFLVSHFKMYDTTSAPKLFKINVIRLILSSLIDSFWVSFLFVHLKSFFYYSEYWCVLQKKNIRKRFINVLAQTCKDKKKGLSLMYVRFYLLNTNYVKNEPLLYHSGDALYQTLLVKTIFDTAPCFNNIDLFW